MRDKLIHNYFGVKIELVWETIKQNIPELNKEIKGIVNEMNKKDNNYL